ncbi:MAG TPA: hypothetical protein VFK89_02265 [Actinomycetota bacterium]|nr:hypothetical protein [Actinomycetota bacterium]
MRRFASLAVLVLVAFATVPVAAAQASPHRVVLAQTGGGSDTGDAGATNKDASQQGESQDQAAGKGQSDPEAETGGSNSKETTEEEGPPWTYQMARIGIALLIFMFLGLGLLYYRMIAKRQRGIA